MALYEFKCGDCETGFEVMRSMSAADAPDECPNCGSNGARRQLSSFASFSGGADYASSFTPAMQRSAGGCCGGGCCSH